MPGEMRPGDIFLLFASGSCGVCSLRLGLFLAWASLIVRAREKPVDDVGAAHVFFTAG